MRRIKTGLVLATALVMGLSLFGGFYGKYFEVTGLN